ncbi:hypothetical protein BMS96_05140 [Leuconostoc lactis]|nr:hypothetical protein BMS94_07105 [Leuconostoc lactis]ORI86566.1 hypothetical protein BMS96_05140 [Leuconostoc lactis]
MFGLILQSTTRKCQHQKLLKISSIAILAANLKQSASEILKKIAKKAMGGFEFIVTAIMVTLNHDCKAKSYTITGIITTDAQKKVRYTSI